MNAETSLSAEFKKTIVRFRFYMSITNGQFYFYLSDSAHRHSKILLCLMALKICLSSEVENF